MSEAVADPAPPSPAPALSMWQMAALAAVGRLAGQGECERPKNVQFTTLQGLEKLGLVAGRQAERPRSRRFRSRAVPPTLWRITEAGRAVLASSDPASAARQVARAQLYQRDYRVLGR